MADRVGVALWAWDLIMAGLRSLMVIGGSMALGAALHPKKRARRTEDEKPATTATIAPTPAPKPLLISAPPSPREHVS